MKSFIEVTLLTFIATVLALSSTPNTPAPAGTSRSIATTAIEPDSAMTNTAANSVVESVSKTPTPAIEQDASTTVADSFEGQELKSSQVTFQKEAENLNPPGIASPVTTGEQAPAAERSAVTSWPVAAPAAGIPCDYCHGTGTYTSASGWRGKCYTCQGTGVKQVVKPQAAVAAPVRYYVPASSCGPNGCGPAMQSSGYQWQRRPLLRWRR
jgi:hypothetical protein